MIFQKMSRVQFLLKTLQENKNSASEKFQHILQ